MRIQNNRLVGNNGTMVPFESTGNQCGGLTGGKPRFLVTHYTAGGTASGNQLVQEPGLPGLGASGDRP